MHKEKWLKQFCPQAKFNVGTTIKHSPLCGDGMLIVEPNGLSHFGKIRSQKSLRANDTGIKKYASRTSLSDSTWNPATQKPTHGPSFSQRWGFRFLMRMASFEHPVDAQAAHGQGAKVGGLGITPSTGGAVHTRVNHKP